MFFQIRLFRLILEIDWVLDSGARFLRLRRYQRLVGNDQDTGNWNSRKEKMLRQNGHKKCQQ